MTPLLSQHIDDIAALCKQHRVKRLDVFGSAARDDFDPATSDVDFIAEFEAMDASEFTEHYLALLESLEQVLGRPVDLLTDVSRLNKYYRAGIEKSRVQFYAA